MRKIDQVFDCIWRGELLLCLASITRSRKDIMKFFRFSLFVGLASMTFVGCSKKKNSPNPVDNSPPPDSNTSINNRYLRSIALTTDLPPCEFRSEGLVVYIAESLEFKRCFSGGWMDLNLQGPPGSQGSPGAPGLNGSAGSDGISIGVLVEAENSGSNCLQGGKKHSFFKDLNHSGTWNTGEGVLSVSFVCNGSPGTNGSQGAAGATGPNGINIGVLVETESAGSNCAFGGKKHSFFRDVNNNRLYDLGEEVLSVSFVCHGVSNGTIGTTVQPLLPGHKCFYGGITHLSQVTSNVTN